MMSLSFMRLLRSMAVQEKQYYRGRSPALIDLRQEPRNAMETVFPLGRTTNLEEICIGIF